MGGQNFGALILPVEKRFIFLGKIFYGLPPINTLMRFDLNARGGRGADKEKLILMKKCGDDSVLERWIINFVRSLHFSAAQMISTAA